MGLCILHQFKRKRDEEMKELSERLRELEKQWMKRNYHRNCYRREHQDDPYTTHKVYKMVYIIYLALCSLTQAVYISRMSTVNRLRPPTPFRPGVNLQRPWSHTRLVQAASHRAPYVLYRKPPQRYAVKHFAPSTTRNMFAGGPWKTTSRLPMSPVTPEYEFVKAASSAPVVHTNGGAIHTIPAPNLSLSEKPIVVIESSDNPVSKLPRPSYEVTEKYPESEYSVAKIESPIGFSKATSFTTPELQTLIRNGAALQLASEYSLPAISINQHQVIPHQAVHHQYPLQDLQSALPTQQDLINTGADGLFIPPNALYQHDPMFLQKLQNQLLQRFPSVEFIPYAAEAPNQVHLQPEASQIHAQVIHPQIIHPQVVHTQVIPQEFHPQMILLENEQLDKPLSPQHNEPKMVVQRETQENAVVTLIPQSFVVANTTEKQVEETPSPQPENITVELVAAETQPPTTTVKYIIESNTEEQNTTPIYYAQIGQSVGSVIANGFYSAINDVRAAAALAQVDNSPVYKPPENVTTTTNRSDLEAYFVKNDEKSENKTVNELKPLRGVPFSKATDSVNIAYTLVRADDKKSKVNQEGAVYAGQIVEATITEDQDFNKEKASLISRRAPIRLFAVDTKHVASSANTLPQVAVVKAKIPPKSKLTFDDKTGEPILRIYASYVDSPKQKEAIVSKLTNLKQAKDAATRKEAVDNWKAETIKSADKTQGSDTNQVTHFGLKLRERNDYYNEPYFEDYEELHVV